MTEGRPRRQVNPGLVLLLVCLGQYMVLLDISVVNVALPSIRADLGFSATSLQWVVNAYTLAFAGFLLLGGRAADLFGRRRIFLIGVAVFSLASLAGGLASNQGQLVAARALQGLGGAVLSPATLTILLTNYPEGPGRARALGIWSAVAAAGGASGALLGGIVTQLLSWRWILFINVPVGVLVFAGAWLALSETRGDGALRRHLDVLGAVTVTGGLVAVVWAIARSEAQGWASVEVLGSLGVGVALLGCFVAVEARVSRAPLVPLRLFRSRSISAANLVSLGVGASMFAMWYFQSLYLQGVRGQSPLAAGLTFIPQTIAIVAGAQVSTRLVARTGARPLLVLGPLVIAAGLLWLSRLSVDASVVSAVVLPGSLVAFGGGLCFPTMTLAATAGVSRSESGLASGVINTTRQIGGSLGLAALITVAATHAASLATTGSSATAALTQGFGRALAVAAGVAVVTAVLGIGIPGRPGLRARQVQPSVEAAA